MQKFLTISFVTLGLLAAPSIAQAQCLLCGVVGFMIGSAGNSASANVPNGGLAGDVLYIMPHVGERVTDPLGTRQVSSLLSVGTKDIAGNEHSSLQQVFARAMTDSENYDILAVQRLITSRDHVITLLFTYIEKDKVVPLNQLPQSDPK